MSVRMPKPDSAAKLMRKHLAEKGLIVTHAQALELIAKLYGYNSYYAMKREEKSSVYHSPTVRNDVPLRLSLEELKRGLKVTVENVSVELSATEGGICVDLSSAVYPQQSPLASAQVLFEQAAKDRLTPDVSLLFFGCRLPWKVTGMDIRYPGTQSLEFLRVIATHSYDSYLEWLETQMPNDDHDLSETAIVLKKEPWSLSGEDLVRSRLEADGKFTLVNNTAYAGMEFYLLDENGERWKPMKRV